MNGRGKENWVGKQAEKQTKSDGKKKLTESEQKDGKRMENQRTLSCKNGQEEKGRNRNGQGKKK